MTSNEILTPQHPLWDNFAEMLYGLLESCYGDFRTCRALLEDTPFDTEATLTYFEEHGGHCDCEVLANVDTAAKKEPVPGELT